MPSRPESRSRKKKVYILSIDGGGIRGVIPLTVLAALEKRLGGPISDYFDLLAGTSTGGIVSLTLARSTPSGKAYYSAQQILDIYKASGPSLFRRSLWRRLKTGFGLWGSAYGQSNVQSNADAYFGDARLSACRTECLVTAYDIQSDKPHYFKSSWARENPLHFDYPMSIAGQATGSAPTYFPPIEVQNEAGKSFTLVDGGIIRNNPSEAALSYAKQLYPYAEEFHLLSLGTGRVETSATANMTGMAQWGSSIIEFIMDGSGQATDLELRQAFQALRKSGHHGESNYLRLQPVMELKDQDMTNTSPENLNKLQDYAEKEMALHAKALDNFVANLKKAAGQKVEMQEVEAAEVAIETKKKGLFKRLFAASG